MSRGMQFIHGSSFVRLLFAPDTLYFRIQGLFSLLLSPLNATRLFMTGYVFLFLYGYWFMLKAFGRHPWVMLLVVPLVFNGALCRGNLNLALGIAVFPWVLYGFRRAYRAPTWQNTVLLTVLDLVLYYASLSVFLGALVFQFIMIIQSVRGKRLVSFAIATLVSLVPLIAWVKRNVLATWYASVLHGPRTFLHSWYSVIGNCFKGPVDEVAVVLAMLAWVFGVLVRDRDETAKKLDLGGLSLVLLVFLMPSLGWAGTGMGSAMAIPAIMVMIAAIATKQRKWQAWTGALAVGAAVLALIAANIGMVRWMQESRVYPELERLIGHDPMVVELCRGKRSNALTYPGWSYWNACIFADTGPATTHVNPDLPKSRTFIQCRANIIPTSNSVLIMKSQGWYIYKEVLAPKKVTPPRSPVKQLKAPPRIPLLRLPVINRLKIK